MIGAAYRSFPAKVNAGFIENGNGSTSWNDASGKWSGVIDKLNGQLDEINYLSREASTVMDAETGKATMTKLSELKSEIDGLKSSAQSMKDGSEKVAGAYDSAKDSIYTIAEIERVENKMQTLSNLTGITGAVRKFFAKESEAELGAQFVEMTRHNGEVLDSYATAISEAFPESLGQSGETGHGGGIDGISGSAYTHVSSAGGSGAGVGYSGAGGYSATSASGASYGAGPSGGGMFGRTSARYGAGQRRSANIPGVSEDDLIDINKYLSQFSNQNMASTGMTPRGTGFALGDFNGNHAAVPKEKYGSSDFGTGLSFYNPTPSFGGFDGGFNRSTFTPFTSASSFDKPGSGISSAGLGAAGGIASMNGSSKPSYASDSRMAGTRLSNASARTPFIGLPGGLSGMSRFAGAGSMNPGAFRGTGVRGAVNGLTGGLGMGSASATANPGTGFGGVQTTSAAQTPARPMMPGMVPPMSGAGAGGKKNGQSSKQSIQSSDTNIFADIHAFGAQRSEEQSGAEGAESDGSRFVPVR